MKKTCLLILTLFIIATFCCKIIAAERFVVIADAEVPELMKTVKSFGAFSEPIIPGSSMLILGSVIAFNFNPQFAPFDITSNLRVMAYGDSVEEKTLPIVCGFAKRNSDQPLPKTIKIDKSKFFVKSMDGQAAVSSSDILLENLKIIENSTISDADVVINIFPDQYLKQCAGNIKFLRGEFDREISEKNIAEFIPDNKVVEKLLAQCRKLQIKVKAHRKNLDLDMMVYPVDNSELGTFVKAKQTGDVAPEGIIDLGKKISGNNSFNLNDGLNGLVTFVLLKIFPKGNSEDFSKLCKIKVSNQQKYLHFNTSIDQGALKSTLISAGVIKQQQKNDR